MATIFNKEERQRYPSFSKITCKVPSHKVAKRNEMAAAAIVNYREKYPSFSNIKHKINYGKGYQRLLVAKRWRQNGGGGGVQYRIRPSSVPEASPRNVKEILKNSAAIIRVDRHLSPQRNVISPKNVLNEENESSDTRRGTKMGKMEASSSSHFFSSLHRKQIRLAFKGGSRLLTLPFSFPSLCGSKI